jgi:hypothetical protein
VVSTGRGNTLSWRGKMEYVVTRRYRRGFTVAEKTELWGRWQRGASLKVIGRAFGNASWRRDRSRRLRLVWSICGKLIAGHFLSFATVRHEQKSILIRSPRRRGQVYSLSFLNLSNSTTDKAQEPGPLGVRFPVIFGQAVPARSVAAHRRRELFRCTDGPCPR